jgi:hypothetical protein
MHVLMRVVVVNTHPIFIKTLQKSINTLLIRKMYKSVRKRENLKDIKLAQTTKITFIINDDK